MADVIVVIPTPEEAHLKCRICLSQDSNFYSFNDLLVIPPDRELSIADALCELGNELITNVTNPLLPQQACENCVTQLRDLYIFRLAFITSNLVWKEYLSQLESLPDTKDEVIEAENVDPWEELDFKVKKKRKQLQPISKIRHPCPFCTNRHFTALELKKHIKTHAELKNYLTAKGIPKFDKKVRFFAVQDTKVKPLFSRNPIKHKCIYCDVRLTVDEFDDHLNQHIKDGNIKCDICNRRFHSIGALRNHRLIHIQNFPFHCKECNKGFLQEKSYKCHLLAHKNVYLHSCEICGKAFCSPKNLNTHISAVHNNIKTEKGNKYPFKCKKCLTRYSSKYELANHECNPILRLKKRSTLHPYQKSLKNLFNSKSLCHLCGKYYINIHSHMARHSKEGEQLNNSKQSTGQKTVLCPVCGKYISQAFFNRHQRWHSGDKPFVCNLCNKAFIEKRRLMRHMKSHQDPFLRKALTKNRLVPISVQPSTASV